MQTSWHETFKTISNQRPTISRVEETIRNAGRRAPHQLRVTPVSWWCIEPAPVTGCKWRRFSECVAGTQDQDSSCGGRTERWFTVDVLGEPEAITSKEELDVKKYGVIVTKGRKRGLLLPDLDGVDSVEEQIAIARRKAGIREEDEVSLERFEVIRHGEKG
ncbi:MAG: AMMECR1 domain-containing protein [Eisenbergiella massiliensis]